MLEMNSTLVPYIVGHTPAGTSTLNMIHYAQSVRSSLLQIRGSGVARSSSLMS